MMIDTHAHLDDPRLKSDLEGVLERARAAGVTQIVAIGTTVKDSVAVQELAQCYPGVFASVGIHPNDAAETNEEDWSRIVELASRPGVVALGETGLDRYWDRTPFPVQQEWFSRHLELANRLELPVVIHCRDCQRDLIDHMKGFGRVIEGVQHSFTGSWEEAEALLDLGLCISFAGMLTYTNKSLDGLRVVASRLPIDRILIETDSPYLSPHPFRGKTNEPARVALTAQRLAEVRGLPLSEILRVTTENAQRLFRLPADQVL